MHVSYGRGSRRLSESDGGRRCPGYLALRRVLTAVPLGLILATTGCLEPGLDQAACWPHPERGVRNAIPHGGVRAQIALDQNAACLPPSQARRYQQQLDRSRAGP
jgi:hypothetical protein